MTDGELTELLIDCPTLYHMAERGSWPSIRDHGLLSTSALLDRFGIAGVARATIEVTRRPANVVLDKPGIGRAVLRDQSPIDDRALARCLQDGLSPTDWYRRLNRRVFFWLTRHRVLRLLNARAYREQQHDVLALDAKRLIEAYRDRIWLCPINSGCTRPFPRTRGEATFRRLADYPYAQWKRQRKPGERIVELAADYAVPDVARFVARVVRMQAAQELAVLFET